MPLYPHYEGLLRGDACTITVRVLASSAPVGGVRLLDLTRRIELAYGDGSDIRPLCESSVDVEAYDDEAGSLTAFISSLTNEGEAVLEIAWADPATGQDCTWSGGIAPGTLYDVPLYPRIKKKAIRFSAACGLVRLGENAPEWMRDTNNAPTYLTLRDFWQRLFAAMEPPGTPRRTVDYSPAIRPSVWRVLAPPLAYAPHWFMGTSMRPVAQTGSARQDTSGTLRSVAEALLVAMELRAFLGLDGRWQVAGAEGVAMASTLRDPPGVPDPVVVARPARTIALDPARTEATATVTHARPSASVDVSLPLSGEQVELVRDKGMAYWHAGVPLLFAVSAKDGSVTFVAGPSGNGAARLVVTGRFVGDEHATLTSHLVRLKQGEKLRLRVALDHRTPGAAASVMWRLRLIPDDPAAQAWTGRPGLGWTASDVWVNSSSTSGTWTTLSGDVAGAVPASGRLVLEVRSESVDAVDVSRLSCLVGTWTEGEAVPVPPALPAMVVPRLLVGVAALPGAVGHQAKLTLSTHEFNDHLGPLIWSDTGAGYSPVAWIDASGALRWSLQELAAQRMLGPKKRLEVTYRGLVVPGMRVLVDLPNAPGTAFIVASCRVDLARYQTRASLVTP